MAAPDLKQPSTTARKGPTTVARAYFQALGEHDLEAAADLWKPGSLDRVVGIVDMVVPADLKQWFGGMFKAFPDLRIEVLSVTAQKERAAVRWTARGTFNGSGKFEGLSPNGASLVMEGFDLLTIRDGLIVENHAYLNGADLARQLGALPPRGSVAERGMTAALNAKVAATKRLEQLRDR